MNRHTKLIDSAKHGIRLLDRRPPNTTPYVLDLLDKLRKQASRKLRRAVQGETVTDLDIDAVNEAAEVQRSLVHGIDKAVRVERSFHSRTVLSANANPLTCWS